MADQTISIERNGHTYSGTFSVEKGMVRVSSGYGPGSETIQVGGSPPDVIARILLSEMIAEHYSSPR
jgi:hypothetical protein